jgi:alkylhydroperoxidase family enzyme
VRAIIDDYTRAPISDADVTMLGFVDKLTRTPADMQPEDVEALREAGFEDRSIHDLVLVASYYAFVNRVADGLGVELEPGWDAKEFRGPYD